MKILEQEFQGDNQARVVKFQFFRGEFENLRMQEFELGQDYFSRVINIVNHLRSISDDVHEEKVIVKILNCIPKKFDHVIIVIEESKDLITLLAVGIVGSVNAIVVRSLGT